MSLRHWVIRGLILGGLAAAAAAVWIANSWVSPERVRAQVVANIQQQLEEGVEVSVGAARIRILGGIAVDDLRLTRRTAAGETATVLSVPSAVLYHDKEQLNRGQLVIKKIELENPEVNLERSAAGAWNLAGVFKPGPADKPVPTFVIHSGTVHLIDRGDSPLPEMTLAGVQLTLVNDPIPILAIQQARATLNKIGPVVVWARYNRISGELKLNLELSEVPVSALAAKVDRFAPGLARHLAGLGATAAINATLAYDPPSPAVRGSSGRWQHDVDIRVKDARYVNTDLPWPVENISAMVKVKNGQVFVRNATAQVGSAKVELSLVSRRDAAKAAPPEDDVLKQLEAGFDKLELSISGLALDNVLFRNLPERAQKVRTQFAPEGQIDLTYTFDRSDAGGTRKLEVRPQQVAMTYHGFKYRVTDVRGWVKRTAKPTGEPVTTLDLVGSAGGQLITVKGTITGEGDDPGIDLRVSGNNVPIDATLCAAMPERYRKMVERLGASGRGDFIAEFIQPIGVNRCENEFRIEIRDAAIYHQDLKYHLEKVKGRICLRAAVWDMTRPVRPGETVEPPDRDEMILEGFTAAHDGGTVTLRGSKRAAPNSRDRRLELHLTATSCPFDEDLHALCRACKIGSVWTTFNPSGRVSLDADFEVIEPFGAAPSDSPIVGHDLKLHLSFAGATVLPSFFQYELRDFAGALDYKDRVVKLTHVSGHHGETRVTLAQAEVQFAPDGVVWADLRTLEAKPLVADAAFIAALPGKLASGLDEMKLQGRTDLFVSQLVVLTPPDSGVPPPAPIPPVGGPIARTLYPGQPPVVPVGGDLVAGRPAAPSLSNPDPVVFWDLKLRLSGASFDTGVTWDQAYGVVGCRGRYEGTHLGKVLGDAWLESVAIAGQPVSRVGGRFDTGATVKGKFEVGPQLPDPIRPSEYMPVEIAFTNLTGQLFHGQLGGQAFLALTSPVRFSLWLQAADVQLEDVAKFYRLGTNGEPKAKDPPAQLQGIAQAQLELHNRQDPRTGRFVVEGTGVIDVPTGRMYNLPILLDLVKLLKFEKPDPTAFEEAHAVFHILGDRVRVDQIDLIGRAVCLGGSGEFDTSGNFVKFDFYTLYWQVLARLINTPVGDLTAFLSKNLFVIKLTREGGELKYKSEPLPIVLDPARAVADRLRLRAAQLFGGR